MDRFMLLFIGGVIPEGKWEQSVSDRLQWMQSLRDQDKFIDGSPLSPVGKVISQHTVHDFVHDQNSINGHAIIQAKNIQEAVDIAMNAPQASPEYGSAMVEVRQLQQLV